MKVLWVIICLWWVKKINISANNHIGKETYSYQQGDESNIISPHLDRFRKEVKECEPNDRSGRKTDNKVRLVFEVEWKEATEEGRGKCSERDECEGEWHMLQFIIWENTTGHTISQVGCI